jgi:hypothetical protein
LSTTTYYSIQLPGEGDQDWVTKLNQALATITEKMVRNQMPSSATLRWGDISGGNYIEVSSTDGVKIVGGLHHGTTPGRSLRLPQGEEFPSDPAVGQVFLRSDEGLLYFYYDGDWQALSNPSSESVSAAGGLLVTDLGTDLGGIVVSDGEGATEIVAPGADNTVLASASESTTGWALRTVLQLLGFALAKGELAVGVGSETAEPLEPGADGEVLVADADEDQGLRWASVAALVNEFFSTKGQILARGASDPVAVDAPASNNQVLISDSSAGAGARWADQSELGALPGTRTRVAGDLYLYANYL